MSDENRDSHGIGVYFLHDDLEAEEKKPSAQEEADQQTKLNVVNHLTTRARSTFGPITNPLTHSLAG